MDAIRIGLAKAESELAARLGPMLPRPAEAKRTLSNPFCAPGTITENRDAITITLSPAGTSSEGGCGGTMKTCRCQSDGTWGDCTGGVCSDPRVQSCLDSGGTAGSGLCCALTTDFPNTCSIGACSVHELCSGRNVHRNSPMHEWIGPNLSVQWWQVRLSVMGASASQRLASRHVLITGRRAWK